jgi:hypothetical protein
MRVQPIADHDRAIYPSPAELSLNLPVDGDTCLGIVSVTPRPFLQKRDQARDQADRATRRKRATGIGQHRLPSVERWLHQPSH